MAKRTETRSIAKIKQGIVDHLESAGEGSCSVETIRSGVIEACGAYVRPQYFSKALTALVDDTIVEHGYQLAPDAQPRESDSDLSKKIYLTLMDLDRKCFSTGELTDEVNGKFNQDPPFTTTSVYTECENMLGRLLNECATLK